MKVRLVFQFGKGRLEAGAADKRHVRSKALFDIEALLREQPRQVRIDFEERVIRLREESQLLREYCTQIQSLFQSEIDIRQNRIMQILTIVTTIFLPLTLLVGWYGMNFSGMPELHWKYGYPAIILVSVAVVVLSLWVCKKKKFW